MDIKNLSSLVILDLQDNNFEGSFPVELPHMLQVLQFSSNSINGILPKDDFTNLRM